MSIMNILQNIKIKLHIYNNMNNAKIKRRKDHITNFFNNLDVNEYDKVYVGVTEDELRQRKYQHIRNKKIGCSNSWKIIKIPYTDIKIKDETKINEYIDGITKLENYLIECCGEKFNNKCVNDRNNDGTLTQTGGYGKNITNINAGDVNKFYFFYKKN